jgi:formate transporter
MANNSDFSIDALMPTEMAVKAEAAGIRKAKSSFRSLFILAMLAGAFISVGALFATTISVGTSGVLPYGVIRVLMGLAFCLGLILVVVGGAELFTGNNLIVMAWAGKKISTQELLRNWGIVYLGNFAGSILTAALVFLSRQYLSSSGAVGRTMLTIAVGKVHLEFFQAVALGILCNALVCMAVWLTYSARSVADKIAAIIFPITAFVAAGFEHSVANMYFIPVALFLKEFDPVFAVKAAADAKITLDGFTWGAFIVNNLIPVTLGNIIGGSIMVGIIYWLVYLRK